MGKKKKQSDFKFVVGTSISKCSNKWSVHVRKNDIYLTSKAFGKDYKVSFHESGTCQCSLTNEYVTKTSIPNSERHLDRWKLSLPEDKTPKHIFSILFPYSELIDFTGIDGVDLSNADKLQPPCDGYYLEILIYVLTLGDTEMIDAYIPLSYKFFKACKLPNDSMYTFLYRYEALASEQIMLLNDFKEYVKVKKKQANIEKTVVAFFGTEIDGVRKICEVYV